MRSADADYVLTARVGENSLTAASLTAGSVFNPLSSNCYTFVNGFTMLNIVDKNGGFGAFSPAKYTSSFKVYVNGILLRPAIDSTAANKPIKVVSSAPTFASADDGDYMLYKNGPTAGIVFKFDMKNGDEIQVRYEGDEFV
jgi:hypothetical protein